MSVRATFIHLSGSKRGRSETFDQDLIQIGTAPKSNIRFRPTRDRRVSPFHAQIRFENCEFFLADLGSAAGTFVNDRQVTEIILQDGDLIEVGQGGPKLKFRVRPEDLATCTPLRVILSDSQALARASPAGRLDGATAFVTYLARAIMREASWKVKGAGLVLALLLVAFLVGFPVALYTGYRSWRSTEKALTTLAARIQGEQILLEDLERRVSEGRRRVEGYRGEVADLGATLQGERQRVAAQLETIERELRALEKERGAGERIIRTYAGGVALLQGTLIFEDPGGRPLRYLGVDEAGRPLRDPLGRAPVSVEGQGPVVKTVFTGTGFLVSREGGILTSRHVVEPWKEDEDLAPVLGLGVRPRVVQFGAFFPGLPAPISVAILRISERADVALLKGDTKGAPLPVLPLDRTGKEAVAGRPVILIGYPAGLDLLLARVDPAVLRTLVKGDEVEIPSLLEELARRKLIRPYTTRGYLGDVRPHQIAYDAETTLGGSGGPIFSLSGRVIGVNYAVSGRFTGSNFGIPVRYGLELF